MPRWFRRLASFVALSCAGTVAALTPAQEAALQAFKARALAAESDTVLVLQDGRPLLDHRRAGAAASH
jgi:hypothetical protein